MTDNYINIVLHEKNWNSDFMRYSKFISDYCRIPRGKIKIHKDYFSFEMSENEIDNYFKSADSGGTAKRDNYLFLIYYEMYITDNASKWLVFLHGFGNDSSSWRYQIAFFLHNGFNILVLDLYGNGKSKINDRIINSEYKIDFHIYYITRMIDTLLENNEFFFIGFSYGGLIVQLMSLAYRTTRLIGVILISSYSLIDEIVKYKISAWIKMLELHDSDKVRIKSILYNLLLCDLFSSHFLEFNKNRFKILEERFIQSNNINCLLSELCHLRDFDSSTFLPEIEKPLLIINAKNDRLISTRMSLPLHLKSQYSKRFILFNKNASHSIHIELFPFVNKIILAEIKKIMNNGYHNIKFPFYAKCRLTNNES
jgi:pimeloyl-ACP methyl ester carboxylesterase